MKFSEKCLKPVKKTMYDLLFGENEFLSEKYTRLYGRSDTEKRIGEFRKRILKRYIAIAAVFSLLLLGNAYTDSKDEMREYVSEKDGKIYVIRPEEGESPIYLDMKAEVKGKDGTLVNKDIQVVIKPISRGEVSEDAGESESGKSEEDRIISSLDQAADSVNSNLNKEEICLPSKLESGESVTWETDVKSDIPVLVTGVLMVLILAVRGKYRSIGREEKLARESIVRELPDFINSLVMLLNAGEVLTTAFLTIVTGRGERKGYFYGQLDEIAVKIRSSNAVLSEELRDFSRRSGVRELIRVSNIVIDNITMGSDLVEKLSRESEMLWFARKKQSEEKGRVAETKMTLPLVLLLLVLLLITVAPVMLEM